MKTNDESDLLLEFEFQRQRTAIVSFQRFRRWLKAYEPPEKKAASDLHRTPQTRLNKKHFDQLRAACEQKPESESES